MRSGLPIDEVLGPLCAALRAQGAAVLQAPPGAGKSTVVPLALLEEDWVDGRRVLMLEPRRLAARAVASRMAKTLGEAVGRTVGYRMRLDTRISRDTRIEVITEGILTRMLQSDPALEDVAVVIFDEFHERSLQADLGLALTLDARAQLNPGLRVLVMSATLDGEAVARLLGDAPLISAPGRAYAVTTHFHGSGPPPLPAARVTDSAERRVTQMTTLALEEESGDILAFLPGAAEIRRVHAQLVASALPPGTQVLPLFGDLSGEQQDAALQPAAAGQRKVVLATNIAETSLTIPGVRVVVDSGLMRRACFDPVTGMSRLETQRISRASAEQRRGRAGRTAPGVCYRGWSEGAQASLAAFTLPEIAAADLAPLALELASWGTRDATELRWLDPPPQAMLASARDLLQLLGALDGTGRITAHGREMARIGVHPRLAHMLLRATELRLLGLAGQLAALLSERDLLRGGGARDVDIRTRLEILRGEATQAASDRGTLQRARQAARALTQQLGGAAAAAPEESSSAGLLLAFAYPDRIARRRAGGEGRYTLANGRGAHFSEPQGLGRQEFIVAVDLDDKDRDARILMAAALDPADLFTHFAAQLVRGESVEWSTRERAVLARRTVTLGALVLEEKPLAQVPPEAARVAMLHGLRELGLAVLSWDRDARDLQARIEFVRAALDAEAATAWPAVNDAALAASFETWLAPWLDGVTRREHLGKISVAEALRALLTWEQRRALDEWAPTHLTMPTGSRIRVDYLDESAPAVSVRLQEVFGLSASPLLGRGRVPVTFKLLSPAQRPVQVTRDLAGFWRGSYAQVRKELRGRYPKHYWPENPLEAQPVRGTRRR